MKKIFKSRKLRKIILSEETRPWKFLTRNKYLDTNRIESDVNLLKNFYKNRGYFNIQIKSSHAKVVQNNNFELIFTIDSGQKFYFNKFSLNNSEDYEGANFEKINKLFDNIKGELYSINSLNKIKEEIDKIALQKEFVFIDAKYEEIVFDKNKININFF